MSKEQQELSINTQQLFTTVAKESNINANRWLPQANNVQSSRNDSD
jgi:hypothetical protein